MDPQTQEPWQHVALLAEQESAEELRTYLHDLPSGDLALALSRLSEDEQSKVLTRLRPEDAADLVGRLSDVQAVELMERLQPIAAAAILDNLPSDEQADLIGELDARDAEAILQAMDPEEAADARTLSRYDDDVAGGLMITEFLQFPEHFLVADVVDDMRGHADQYRDYEVQYAYVCDTKDRFVGVLRLRDLLFENHARPIADITIRNPLSVSDHATLDELADLFDRHHFLGIPVLDGQQRVLGVVKKEAVERAQGDRQERDYLKTLGIVDEEIRTMPLLRRSRGRLSWLSANILLNIIAASVIAIYQDTLAEVIALAVFLPIISDMSGCSGNQAVAVSLRELTLGLVRPTDVMRVWLQEISVGLINGLALGLIIAFVALIWKGNAWLGLVVGFALCLNTMLAVSIGGIIPLVLKKMKMDPAMASGPILTTVTDMCGFFFVLAFASALLPYLK